MKSLLLACVVALCGCAASGCGGAVASAPDASRAPAEQDAGVPACERYARAVEWGRVAEMSLGEISGVVASRDQPGLLWVHNDSGGGPRIFAIEAQGGATRGEWILEGADAFDWEDIALESVGGGPDRLWIGDIGDNDARSGGAGRDHIVVLRIEEPVASDIAGPPAIVAVETITLRYPDRARDAEAMAIDPESGDLYLFAKESLGPSDVFVARAPMTDGADITLERVATIDLGTMVTAADISPEANELVVRTYRSISWWARAEGESWALALARPATRVPNQPEPQGEAIAFTTSERGYLTISEGEHPPIWFHARCAPQD